MGWKTMGAKQHHFVLVHGGSHGAWCWFKIIPLLEKAGHRVSTVDLESAGESPLTADEITSFQQYNQPLVDLFNTFPSDEKVVLVGHSLGGLSVTMMSELFSTKISAAIYLAALMPSGGLNIVEMISNDPLLAPAYEITLNFKVDGGPPTSMDVPPDSLIDYFYNKCSLEDGIFAISRVRSCPLMSNIPFTPTCTKQNYGSVPRIFVLALQDKALRSILARKMLEKNPPSELFEIDTDHSPFFCAPEIVEKILKDTAAKYDL